MEKQAAVNIVRETFQNPFAKNRFIYFSKNLLNSIDETKAFHARGYVPEIFKDHIKTYERIGTYTDPKEKKIDVLIVYLQKETTIERARTAQRNFVARYLKDRGEKDAGLVAFVSSDEDDWRFSFVKMEYKLVETPKGTIKAEEEFTPARRYSFLVGKNENSHTAQSRLVPILADDKQYLTIEQLEEAFDIETVTKEFFIKYRELFIRTKEELDKVVKNDSKIRTDFDAKGVNTVDFAKKLLGQITFLYFLQKKGWFGVGRDAKWGTGSKHFLRELFEKKLTNYKNFFNDILEPLFYEALRVGEERKQDDYYYSRFNCKIPFLNGGLFDPIGNYDWVHTDIILSDSLFSNAVRTKEGDTGDGILDIFDRYNFTVKEDEPLEKEVAIDPELLGKAYEKFNAIRPDNFEEYKKALKSGNKGEESKFNKQYGVYYTPREIVHYMCQESLINYLVTELSSSVIASEAKQSPLPSKEDIETMIHLGEQVSENEEIALIKEQKILEGKQKSSDYKLILPESIRKNASLIDQKLSDITVCDPAVGSGAFPVGMMHEIVKARETLSAYLSLRGSEATKQSQVSPRHSERSEESRTPYNFKRHAIQNCLYGVDIDSGAVEIAKLRLWLSLVVDEDDIKNIKPLPNLDYKIICGNSLLGVEKDLLNAKLFSELEKIKPLYFNETNPTKKQEYKNRIDELISRITNRHKEFDFEVYFSEVFHHKGGFDVVIANPPYIVLSLNELKSFRWTKGNQNAYVAFIEIADKNINASGLISYIIPSTWLAGNNFKELRKESLIKERIQQIIQLPYDIFEAAYVDNVILIMTGKAIKNIRVKTFKFNIRDSLHHEKIIFQEFFTKNWIGSPDSVIFLNKSLLQILEKYQDTPSKRLEEITKVQRGTLPPKENEIIILGGSNQRKKIIRWFAGQVYRYVVVAGSKQYVEHEKLREDKPLEVFQGPRILGRQLVSRQFRLQFAFTEEEFAFKKNLYAIYHCSKQFDYFYLIAILNSKFFSYVQVNLNASGQRDDYPAFSLQDFRNFRIPDITLIKQKPFIDLVNQILATKNKDPDADTSALERQIDQMIYKLYGLTPEEIAIVEGKR